MTTRTERVTQRDDGGGDGASEGRRGILLAGVAVVACPLLCLAPLLVAGLAATGVARALHGFPWPLMVGAMLVVLALGIVSTRRRHARPASDCCAPTAAHPASDRATH